MLPVSVSFVPVYSQEKQLDRINGMAAKNSPTGKDKKGTLDLFENTQGTVEGVEAVDMNDPETLLDEVCMLIDL